MADQRVAVVTGAAAGIGAAIAVRLAADGLLIAAIDIAPPVADGDDIGAPDTLALQADVTDPADVERAIGQVLDQFGRIDVLVNNAGISGSAEATICHTTPVEDWDRVIAVNVRGPFLCTRAVLPTMLAQRSGHVITIASVAGLVAFPGRCAYTASKGAAVQFTKSLAVDYATQGIRANAVCPGMVATAMTQWRLDQPELRAQAEARIPLGRVAQPADIADAVALLASERLSYLNGHAMAVDGGWTAW
jgi:NAD(P)-dependent dehydrogenase (short-subunit alcohol dehydrogenase family)